MDSFSFTRFKLALVLNSSHYLIKQYLYKNFGCNYERSDHVLLL